MNKSDTQITQITQMNSRFEKINLEDILPSTNLYRIFTEGDGNCFFHAICLAYFVPYITRTLDGEKLNRQEFVINLRKDLANKLSQASSMNPKKSNYKLLAAGELKELSKSIPDCSLHNMQNELSTPGLAVSHLYNEFISDQLNIDIYILDYEKKDVYMTGTNLKLLYKNRKSIVLLYVPGHYDLIGYSNTDQKAEVNEVNKAEVNKVNKVNENIRLDNSNLETCFQPDHSLILKIKRRMSELQK